MRAGTRPTLPLSSSSTSRKTSATVAVRLSSWVRSPRTVRTRTPCAASSSDRALAACSSLLPYASTQSKPFAASRCAVASPIPPEPPVMMATVAASAEQCTAAARRARPARGGGATKADTLHASGRRSASRIGGVGSQPRSCVTCHARSLGAHAEVLERDRRVFRCKFLPTPYPPSQAAFIPSLQLCARCCK